MQPNPDPHPEGAGNPHPRNEKTARVERALLSFILAEHPAQLTICELARELNPDSESSAVECAVRDLVGVGLLRCQGAYVLPTNAALYFDRLMTT